MGVTIDLDVAEVGLDYVGEDDGKIADPSLRDEVIRWKMRSAAFLRPSAEPVQRLRAVQRRVLQLDLQALWLIARAGSTGFNRSPDGYPRRRMGG